METINNIANAASKAIWGDTKAHEEPVSGKMGNVAAGEPYDAGNIGEPNEAALSANEPRDTTETKEVPIRPPATGAGSRVEQAQAAATPLPPTPAPEAQAQGQAKTTADDPTQQQEQEQRREEGAGQKQQQQHQPPQPMINPAAVPSASDMRDDSTKAQNDTRSPPPEGKKTEQEQEEDPESRPVKVEGPGPRPLEEVAREHGGDAGAVQQPQPQPHEGAAPDRRRDSAKGMGEGEGEGEGEMYVRSSGLAADGGDFDASRPGAGREADRLLEQKGLHKGEGHVGHADAGEKNGGKEKQGLKSKIKAKLHKPTHPA